MATGPGSVLATQTAASAGHAVYGAFVPRSSPGDVANSGRSSKPMLPQAGASNSMNHSVIAPGPALPKAANMGLSREAVADTVTSSASAGLSDAKTLASSQQPSHEKSNGILTSGSLKRAAPTELMDLTSNDIDESSVGSTVPMDADDEWLRLVPAGAIVDANSLQAQVDMLSRLKTLLANPISPASLVRVLTVCDRPNFEYVSEMPSVLPSASVLVVEHPWRIDRRGCSRHVF